MLPRFRPRKSLFQYTDHFRVKLSECAHVCVCGASGGGMDDTNCQSLPKITLSAVCSLPCKRTKNLNFPLTEAYLTYASKSTHTHHIHTTRPTNSLHLTKRLSDFIKHVMRPVTAGLRKIYDHYIYITSSFR